MKTENRILKGLILVPISLFAIFSILMMNFVFGYLNQSSLTPKEEQLTFLNYLLPLILTVGFILYIPIKKLIGQKKSDKRNWTLILVLLLGAIIATPWQIQNLKWQIGLERIDFIQLTPYLIGIVFTIWAILNEIKIKNGTQQRL
ncbi:MAG: hypothetical protein H6604_09780 [Flavobacteriales bacterium]|nr:hypothetical protein [Flavobacteriales bacterium]